MLLRDAAMLLLALVGLAALLAFLLHRVIAVGDSGLRLFPRCLAAFGWVGGRLVDGIADGYLSAAPLGWKRSLERGCQAGEVLFPV